MARKEAAKLHVEVGRELAERLGYPPDHLDAVPAEALDSFAGVGYHLDLAAMGPWQPVLDPGLGAVRYAGPSLGCLAREGHLE